MRRIAIIALALLMQIAPITGIEPPQICANDECPDLND